MTGASSGIGRATALLLAARGAKPFLVARRRQVLEEAVDEIRENGGTASCFAADISNRADLDKAIDAAEAEFGAIYGLFANAGATGGFTPVSDFSDEDFEAILRTNLTSPFWAIKRLFPNMVAQGRGAIVITGSLASARGLANNVAYVSSKHGVLGLSRAVALEGASRNVRSNCVLPGFIETPAMDKIDQKTLDGLAQIVPQRRIGNAEEVAEVAAFLLSDAASHVTGQALSVDGGMLGTLEVRLPE